MTRGSLIAPALVARGSLIAPALVARGSLIAPALVARGSLIAPALARRLDRLAQRVHAFHRFAHHPLCDRYGGELLRLGKRQRVCRGCSLALVGSVVGVAGGLVLQLSPMTALALLGLALLPALLALRSPQRLRSAAGKWWTRALPGAALGVLLSAAIAAPAAQLLLPGPCAALTGLGLWLAYRRRGPDRSPCQSCPERLGPAPCSGFSEIVRAERVFQRRARQLLTTQPPVDARHALASSRAPSLHGRPMP